MNKEKRYNRIANINLVLGVILMAGAIYCLFFTKGIPHMWIVSMVLTLGSITCTSASGKYDKKYRALRKIREDKEWMGEDYVSKPNITMYGGTTTYNDDYDFNEFDHE